MKFPAEALVPKGGQIYCHIFENRLARSLSWSITVEFEPLRYGDEGFSCSMTCEWIRWPVRNWRELDGRRLEGEDGIESTFYMTEHNTGRRTELVLRRRRANIFMVKMNMLVDFHGHFGDDGNPAMAVHAEVDVPFVGLLVIRDKPATPAELQEIASEFVDLSAYEAPEPWRQHGFIFRPLVAEAERAEQRGHE